MAAMTVDQAMAAAIAHHGAGRFGEAEGIYRKVLAAQPKHDGALHLLGLLAHEAGKSAAAVELIGRAIAVDPGVAEYHSNLATALSAVGEHDRAVDAAGTAIEISPGLAEAHVNLGIALAGKKRLDEAIAALEKAIELNSNLVLAWYNLGQALLDKGQADEAFEALRRTIQLAPGFADAHYKLGTALLERGKLEGAVASLWEAVRLNPNDSAVLNDLGNALKAQGRIEDAIAAYEQAVQLKPDFMEAYSNLGMALRERGRLDEAFVVLAKAVELKPGSGPAYSNLGAMHKDRGEMEEAIACAERAVELQPGDAKVHSSLPYIVQFSFRYDDEAILKECARWERDHALPLAHLIRVHENDRDSGRRIRVGYVSPDFCEHVIGFNVLPLVREHDREAVEVFCYSNREAEREDGMSARFRAATDQWRNIASIDDATAAEMIREDRIDVLVDLSLYTANNRLTLFARKPAPVQGTFAGYPGGTGLHAIDFRLTDPYLDPLEGGSDRWYVERSIRLPHTFWCYDPTEETSEVNELSARTRGYMTFGCLNNFCKVSDQSLKLWARVMRTVEGSRLILLAPAGRASERVIGVLGKEGVEARRITLVPRLGRREYLALHGEIDIGLDTLPYNGHTTSLDAMWMGVPVVTLVGKTIVGRAGFSQLSNLGMGELVAWNEDQFVEIAVGLAGDVGRLAKVRAELRERVKRSPIGDSKGFARGIEAAYRDEWKRWCAR